MPSREEETVLLDKRARVHIQLPLQNGPSSSSSSSSDLASAKQSADKIFEALGASERAALLTHLRIAEARRGSAAGGGAIGGDRDYSLDAYFKTPICTLLYERLPWLVGLLLLESVSAAVLHNFNRMIQKHLVLALFSPMLVGTAGNAGNQPGVVVTRAISAGEMTSEASVRVLRREIILALLTCLSLGVVGFARVIAEHPDEPMGAAVIALSLGIIVFVAIMLGIGFSLCLARCGCDPAAGAAPLLTTLSDVIGICILCFCSVMAFGNS